MKGGRGRGKAHEYVQADTKSSEAGREQAIRERCTGVSMWCDATVSIDVCVHGDAREGGPGPYKVGNER